MNFINRNDVVFNGSGTVDLSRSFFFRGGERLLRPPLDPPLILALVGFKMHSQARAFSQPTRANIHQYQFNNPIISNEISVNVLMSIKQGALYYMNSEKQNYDM